MTQPASHPNPLPDPELLRKRYTKLWERILERYCEELGENVSQAKFAERMGVMAPAVSRITNGKNMPKSHEQLIKLAQLCNAEETEIRVLLAWASALVAFDAGENELGRQFQAM